VPARARIVAAAALAAIALSLASLAAAAGAAPRALEPRLDRALAVPHVSPAASAAFALDLDTGEAVYSRNASLSLLPASNEKLAVTYAALTALGPSFQIETDVLGEGQQTAAIRR
jgi:serine-type D-Ala-D-Ala carboxypeptidase/endopeptidase (penicillin-binding protein 4)